MKMKQTYIFETVAKCFLADLTKEKCVTITNVEVSPNDSNFGQQNDDNSENNYNHRERNILQGNQKSLFEAKISIITSITRILPAEINEIAIEAIMVDSCKSIRRHQKVV